MKKIITVLLLAIMFMGGTGAVFAQDGTSTNDTTKEVKANHVKFELRKEFLTEEHQINALDKTRLQLRIEVIDKRDQLLDLYIAARDNGDKEALQAAKEIEQQIDQINNEISGLHDQIKTAHDSFKEALKNKDLDTARSQITQAIDFLGSINDKIKQKIQLLDQIITILAQ